MSFRVNASPDMTRSNAAVALFGTWHAGTLERQRTTVEAITAAREGRDWPSADLLSYSVFASTDGNSVLTYSQWAAKGGSQELVHAWKTEIDGTDSSR